jgi:hypothetical protein
VELFFSSVAKYPLGLDSMSHGHGTLVAEIGQGLAVVRSYVTLATSSTTSVFPCKIRTRQKFIAGCQLNLHHVYCISKFCTSIYQFLA